MWYKVRMNNGYEANILNNPRKDDGIGKSKLEPEFIGLIIGILMCAFLKLGRVYAIIVLVFWTGVGAAISSKLFKKLEYVKVKDLQKEHFFCAKQIPVSLLAERISKADELKKFSISVSNGEDVLLLNKNNKIYNVFYDGPNSFAINHNLDDGEIRLKDVTEDYGNIAYCIQKAIQNIDYYQ